MLPLNNKTSLYITDSNRLVNHDEINETPPAISPFLFPDHSPSGAFLRALYYEGLIDSNFKIIKEKFKNIQFTSLFLDQIQELYQLIRYKKIPLKIETKSFFEKENNAKETEPHCRITLEELNEHLKAFAKEKYGINLNPLLVGGYMRFILLNSLKYCQFTFSKLGSSKINSVITPELLERAKRKAPDVDFNYLIPLQNFSPQETDNLYAFTNEVLNCFKSKIKKEQGIYATQQDVRSCVSNFFVLLPPPKISNSRNLDRRVNQILPRGVSETVKKVKEDIAHFGLVSFPRNHPFKIDVVFDKAPNNACTFQSIALDVHKMQFVTSSDECWQILIDMLGLILHIEEPDLCNHKSWPLAVSYYTRGYVCHDVEAFESLFIKTQNSKDGFIECLKKCFFNHHTSNSSSAMALTFQACIFLRNKINPSILWKEMKALWKFLPLEKDNLFTLIDEEMSKSESSFEHLLFSLQVLGFLELFSSTHRLFEVDLKAQAKKPVLQFKIQSLTGALYFILPFEVEKFSYELAQELFYKESFFKKLYLNYQTELVEPGFGNRVLQYRDFFEFSWQNLEIQAEKMIDVPNQKLHFFSLNLLLCCYKIEPTQAKFNKISNLLFSLIENSLKDFPPQLFFHLNECLLCSSAEEAKSAEPLLNLLEKGDFLSFVKQWMLTLANQKEGAKFAVSLLKKFFLATPSPDSEKSCLGLVKSLCKENIIVAIQLYEEMAKRRQKYFLQPEMIEQLITSICLPKNQNYCFQLCQILEKIVFNLKVPRNFNEKIWDKFFKRLISQNYAINAALLLTEMINHDFFISDKKLNHLKIVLCEEVFKKSDIDSSFKTIQSLLTRYDWSLYDKCSQQEKNKIKSRYIEFIYRLANKIFKSDQKIQMNHKVSDLLKSICKKVRKNSIQEKKIINFALRYLTVEINAGKTVMPANFFRKGSQAIQQIEFQIKIKNIETEFKEKNYKLAFLLLANFRDKILEKADSQKLVEIQLQALKQAFEDKDLNSIKEIARRVAEISVTKNQQLSIENCFRSLLHSQEGSEKLEEIVYEQMMPLLIKNENNAFEIKLECLKKLYDIFKLRGSSKLYRILTDIIYNAFTEKEINSNLSKENSLQTCFFLNTFFKENSLQIILMPKILKDQISLSFSSMVALLKEENKCETICELVESIKSQKIMEKFSESVVDDYLCSSLILNNDPIKIGNFLLAHPSPKHLKIAEKVIEKLSKFIDSDRLNLALNLLLSFKNCSSILWKEIYEKIALNTDVKIKMKAWETLIECDEKTGCLDESPSDRAHCWLSGLSCLTNLQNRKVLNILSDNKEKINKIFKDFHDLYVKASILIVISTFSSFSQNKNHDSLKTFLEFDRFALNNCRDLESKYLTDYAIKIMDKISGSSLPDLQSHFDLRLALYFMEITKKPTLFSSTIIPHLKQFFENSLSSKNTVSINQFLYYLDFIHQSKEIRKQNEILLLLKDLLKSKNANSLTWIWEALIKFSETQKQINSEENRPDKDEKFSVCLAEILKAFLSIESQSSLILNSIFSTKTFDHCLQPTELASMRISCLLKYFEKAKKAGTLEFYNFCINLYLQNLPLIISYEEDSIQCLQQAIEIALIICATTHSFNSIEKIYRHYGCLLLKMPLFEFVVSMGNTFATIVKEYNSIYKIQAINEKKGVHSHFFLYHLTFFSNITKTNSHEFNSLFPEVLKPNERSPFINISFFNLQLQYILINFFLKTSLPWFSTILFNILPKYYFQRLFLYDNTSLSPTELEVVNQILNFEFKEEKTHKQNIKDQKIAQFQIRGLLRSKCLNLPEQLSSNLKLFLSQDGLTQVIKNVAIHSQIEPIDKLQIALHLLSIQEFNDLSTPLDLHLELVETLNKYPFFICEINNLSMCHFFTENIIKFLEKFSRLSTESEKIQKFKTADLFEIIENFCGLYEDFDLKLQKFGEKTTFLTFAFQITKHALHHKLVTYPEYYRILTILIVCDIGKRGDKSLCYAEKDAIDKDHHDIILEMICCPILPDLFLQDPVYLERGTRFRRMETFKFLMKQMQEVGILIGARSSFFNRADVEFQIFENDKEKSKIHQAIFGN
jgi:hypothetical protein